MAKAIWLRSRSGFCGFALVDDEDYERIAKRRWRMIRTSRATNWYAARGGLQVYMHYDVAGVENHWETIFILDHINGYGWDNRKQNLRWATYEENAQNRTRGRYKNIIALDQEAKEAILELLEDKSNITLELTRRRMALQALGVF